LTAASGSIAALLFAIACQRVRAKRGPMTGSGGRSSKRKNFYDVLDAPPSRGMTGGVALLARSGPFG
jgi:hypothetical protein